MDYPIIKIRVTLESFNRELIELSYRHIVTALHDIDINWPQLSPITSIKCIPLPTRKRIYCVLRSPHVNKDSREHFEIRMHKRILEVCYESGRDMDICDELAKIDLPAGVAYRLDILEV